MGKKSEAFYGDLLERDDRYLTKLDNLPTPNLALLTGARAVIDADPARWNQRYWGSKNDNVQSNCPIVAPTACGTAFCLAGWVMVMLGWKATAFGYDAGDGTGDSAISEWTHSQTNEKIGDAQTQQHAARALGLTTNWSDYDDETGEYGAGPETDLFGARNRVEDLDKHIDQIRNRAERQSRARMLIAKRARKAAKVAEKTAAKAASTTTVTEFGAVTMGQSDGPINPFISASQSEAIVRDSLRGDW